MKSRLTSSSHRLPVSLTFILLLGLVVLVVLALASRRLASSPVSHPVVQTQPVPTAKPLSQAPLTNGIKSPVATAAVLPSRPVFQRHAFPVGYEGPNFQWALADGKETNIIRQLAHNELEYQRMVTENRTIYRRQLVYFSQGFDAQAQQALQNGGRLQQIALPGLDGQVFSVDVKNADLRDGGIRGQIYGQLPGQPDSMVTVAFINDREAFTIISPQDQVYLQAEAHEPGEVVVKSIDPQTYGLPQN